MKVIFLVVVIMFIAFGCSKNVIIRSKINNSELKITRVGIMDT